MSVICFSIHYLLYLRQINSHHMAGQVRPHKRNLLDIYYGSFTLPTPVQSSLMDDIAAMDITVVPTTAEGFIAQQLLEFLDAPAMGIGIPFLVPIGGPAELPWTWDQLGSANFVFFYGEVSCGGVLKARKIGSHAGSQDDTFWGFVEGLSLETPPDRFLVPIVGAPGVLTPVEKEIAEFLKKSRTEEHGHAPSGDSSGRKGFYHVHDLTGGLHRVSAKAVGMERMVALNGLARELDPARFKEFLFDLVFDAKAFQAKCLEYRDTLMGPTDPNFSLALVPYITKLEVWKDLTKFRAAVLGLWSRSSWLGISLLDFRRSGVPPWGPDATYSGRDELVNALQSWELFCRALKGDVFEGCMRPITDLMKRADNPLRIYHDIYLQFQLEGLFCTYYGEICKHEGTKSKKFPLQDLVVPADCARFLGLLVAEFVAAALAPGTLHGAWETAPHHVTYGSESLFTAILKPVDSVSVSHGDQGLCVWYLLGQLGLKNAQGELYECRVKGVSHAPLNTVRHSVVQELVRTPDFIAGCKNTSVRDALRTAVDANAALFA